MSGDETIEGEDGPIPVYWARPPGVGPFPGVVVIHDLLGLTRDARRHADWLADAGFLAIVPDLYSRGNRLTCIRATFKSLAARTGPAFDDIEAARRTLAEDPACSGKVGVIGFYLGGGFALLAAAHRGFDASSVNYGTVPPDAPALLEGACPIVGSFGGKDRALRGGAVALASALVVNNIENDVLEYPEANHSFMDRHSGIGGWMLARVGFAYREADAADARHRITRFFLRHLA